MRNRFSRTEWSASQGMMHHNVWGVPSWQTASFQTRCPEPCLQMLSHQANFLLILPPSLYRLFVASGRRLLNWKRLSSPFSRSFLTRSLPCPLLFLSQQESEGASRLAPLNQRLHSALALQSRTTLIEVEQKKRSEEGTPDPWRETSVVPESLKRYILYDNNSA